MRSFLRSARRGGQHPHIMPLTLRANQVPPSAEMGWRLSLENRYIVITTAGVAELADAQDLGSCGRKVVGVQIPPPAPSL